MHLPRRRRPPTILNRIADSRSMRLGFLPTEAAPASTHVVGSEPLDGGWKSGSPLSQRSTTLSGRPCCSLSRSGPRGRTSPNSSHSPDGASVVSRPPPRLNASSVCSRPSSGWSRSRRDRVRRLDAGGRADGPELAVANTVIDLAYAATSTWSSYCERDSRGGQND